jgi:hypothetical protein
MIYCFTTKTKSLPGALSPNSPNFGWILFIQVIPIPLIYLMRNPVDLRDDEKKYHPKIEVEVE